MKSLTTHVVNLGSEPFIHSCPSHSLYTNNKSVAFTLRKADLSQKRNSNYEACVSWFQSDSPSFSERNDETFSPEQIVEQSTGPLPRPESSRLICFLTYSRVTLSTLLCGLCVDEGLVGSNCEVLLRATCIGMLCLRRKNYFSREQLSDYTANMNSIAEM